MRNLSYAKKEQVSYKNQDEETITWSLKQLLDVNSILDDDFDLTSDGVDLYARHFRNYQACHSFEPFLSSHSQQRYRY
ncbi:MAG: DUF4288 domain-containing protein [Nostoc sp.]|uniref:DUF4288 domain-containing protein n=1 Tax=Nostoc sp. TaxID=1180 RepID=UPI002FFA0DF3